MLNTISWGFRIWPPFWPQRLQFRAQPQSFFEDFCQLNLGSKINPLVFEAFNTKFEWISYLTNDWTLDLKLWAASSNSVGIETIFRNIFEPNCWEVLKNFVKTFVFIDPPALVLMAARKIIFQNHSTYLFTMAKWRNERFHEKFEIGRNQWNWAPIFTKCK